MLLNFAAALFYVTNLGVIKKMHQGFCVRQEKTGRRGCPQARDNRQISKSFYEKCKGFNGYSAA